MQKKYFFFTLITLILLTLFSCSKQEAFPKQTSINGQDISGKSPKAAKKLVESACEKQLAQIYYTVNSKAGSVSFTAKELGVHFDTDSALKEALKNGGEITAKLVVNRETAVAAFEAAKQKLTTSPKQAYAKYNRSGEFEFFHGEDGEEPKPQALADALEKSVSTATSQTLNVDMQPIEPNGESYEKLIENNSVISEFTTSFNKEPYNATGRVNNIKKAANAVNGTVLKSGQQLNVNATLGDRNEENGWFKAPGIRNGKYNLEYGGGVCQVSTTLYNAALLANLEIVERTPHSWPVGYVDIGRDATISTGGPNLIIANNTKNTITVAAIVNEDSNTLTVKIFGKKPSNYAYTTLSSSKTGTLSSPSPQYIYDESLKPGEYVTDRKARNGQTSVTYRSFYDKNGKVLKTEVVTEDTYKAFSAIILYGK